MEVEMKVVAFRTVGPEGPALLKAAREKWVNEEEPKIEAFRARFGEHITEEPDNIAFHYNTASGYLYGFSVQADVAERVDLPDDSPWRREGWRDREFVPRKRTKVGKELAVEMNRLRLWMPELRTKPLGLPIIAWGDGYTTVLDPNVIYPESLYDGVSPLWLATSMPGGEKALREATRRSHVGWEHVPGSEYLRLIEERDAANADKP